MFPNPTPTLSSRPTRAALLAAGLTAFLALSAPLAAVTISNATVDLTAATPTITLYSLGDDFGIVQGKAYQVLDGSPDNLTIVSWTTERVVAELSVTTPSDYLVAVKPDGGQLVFWSLTVPERRLPAPPCFDNANRYVDCGNGTVTDSVTGLVWLKTGGCFAEQNYADAQTTAAALQDGECGLTDGSRPGDWRLARKEEWFKLTSKAEGMACEPTLLDATGLACWSEGDPFENVVSDNYWSATAIENTPANAAVTTLLVGGGGVGLAKTDLSSVWPVRSRP